MKSEQAFNPFLPSYEYIPDAEPYVFGNRVYIYGSHDRFDGEDFCMNDYVCWSAPVDNLGAWKKEGVIYRAVQDPMNEDGSQHLFAPDVQVGEDGRYYLFYCLHRSPTVSVAVCDEPAGEYQFYGHIHYADGTLYGQKTGDVFNFDPGVLRDDNGKIYLYTGLSYLKDAPMRKYLAGKFQIDGSYCVELEKDMLTLKSEPVLAVPGEVLAEGTDFEGHGFFEASSPRKINGRYYMVYSSVKSHDLCYAVSEFPVGGFRYGGIIVSIGDVGIVEEGQAVNYLGNTHGGLVEIEGHWYVFYHRHTNRHRNSRQMCAEQIRIAEDGKIAQAEVTSCGLNGGPLNGLGKYEARIACNLSSAEGTFMYQKEKMTGEEKHPYFTQEGEDREDDSNQYIANLRDGAWAGFKYFDIQESDRIKVCVRGNAEGEMLIQDEKDGEIRAVIPIHPSADWQEEVGEFYIEPGIYALYFTYRGSGSIDWKWFEFCEKEKALMGKEYFCNPLNVPYRYQFNKPQMQGMSGDVPTQVAREAADPSMIQFQGKYYIFASVTLSVWVSEDMVHWESHRLPEALPLYDYAPDARVVGDYVYFCASKKEEACSFYRTKDIIHGPYEEIKGTFPFWDPNLFVDDDGRMYFYWGCSNMTPVWGVELDPETMKPLTEKKELIWSDAWTKGYERSGEDHCAPPFPEEEIEVRYQEFLKSHHIEEALLPESMIMQLHGHVSRKPYIEGAWMDKYQGRYYLQYACTGAEYNVYSDGVYVSDSPLGPFTLADNNPYSYKPGGFLPGAGHGSTMQDGKGNLWHTSTMRISKNHVFERRVGIWPAGFDADGELFCNQRYGDWPIEVEDGKMDPWKNPQWYLLSYGKPAKASSFAEGKDPKFATDENVQTWWRSATERSGEWIQVDLEKSYMINAVQVNFADDGINIPVPGKIRGTTQARYIEEKDHVTRWKLEGSLDGDKYFMIEDKSEADTDLPHDLVVRKEGIQVRFLKLTVIEVPYGQQPCISGLRIFGRGDGEKPEIPEFEVCRENDLDMMVKIKGTNAVGHNILWGSKPDKLYHSYMIFGKEQRIGALVKGKEYYVRVDAFNENGITEGNIVKIPEVAVIEK